MTYHVPRPRLPMINAHHPTQGMPGGLVVAFPLNEGSGKITNGYPRGSIGTGTTHGWRKTPAGFGAEFVATSNERIDVALPTLHAATSGCVSLWCIPDSLAAQIQLIGFGGAADTGNGGFLQLHALTTGKVQIRKRDQNTSSLPSVTGDTVMTAGNVYHVVASATGAANGWAIWVNGHAETLTTSVANSGIWYGAAVVTAPKHLTIGQVQIDGLYSAASWDGTIWDVRWYNRIPTTAWVNELYLHGDELYKLRA
ncbi:MAG: hypothetical protein A3E01_02825 [Gammaproteobacteria bacterium RIFCSPHIGHO2_12_FULL_63_22]|nr:MAG: hypothetical protein A3E01_02825 [Gammaproteobacteria bacterium RIFCSPHIGHO2_12_FULL_63_22]